MARLLTISGMLGMLVTAEALLAHDDRGDIAPPTRCTFTAHGDVASCESLSALGGEPPERFQAK